MMFTVGLGLPFFLPPITRLPPFLPTPSAWRAISGLSMLTLLASKCSCSCAVPLEQEVASITLLQHC